MNRLLFVLCSLCVLLSVGGLSTSARAQAGVDAVMPPGPVFTVRRFALVVGANDGGGDRPVLRFANSDALAVGAVLRGFGGVSQTDLQTLEDPTPGELMEAIASMSDRIRRARRSGQHVQFVFYYSGHSDEQGLLLEGELVTYKELRRKVQAVPADVRIAVLDSCASGAFTRTKGGTKRAPFLVSPAAEVKGHAFLTSSSMDEAAQESDRVGGSFFTHYFTTGLRGAADVDGDRLITLSEAYQFAFDETLARTEATRGGAQHAAYDIQLAGSGDLVMTDLRETSAQLVLSEPIGGRIFVRNAEGQLVAELYKPPGSSPVGLALEPGRYQVSVDDGQLLFRAELSIQKGRRAVLERDDLVRVPLESTVQRGDGTASGEGSGDDPDADPDPDEYTTIPFNFGLLPPLSINGTDKSGKKIINVGSLALLWSKAARIDGIAIALGGSRAQERMYGAQLSFGANIAGEVGGFQLSNAFNTAQQLQGAQASMVNHAKVVERGFQGGFVNVAGSLRGAQLGLVNVGRGLVRGAQLSLINVGGDVRGAQVGLFNFSRQADAAVGLLSITREGGVHPEVSVSDTAAINVGLRFPARYTYTFFDVGIQPGGRGAGWQAGMGFGGRVRLPKDLFLDIDLAGYAVFRGFDSIRNTGVLSKLRLTLAWEPFKRLSVFGGPTLNVLTDIEPGTQLLARPGIFQFDGVDVRDNAGGFRVRTWPGFVAGLRF